MTAELPMQRGLEAVYADWKAAAVPRMEPAKSERTPAGIAFPGSASLAEFMERHKGLLATVLPDAFRLINRKTTAVRDSVAGSARTLRNDAGKIALAGSVAVLLLSSCTAPAAPTPVIPLETPIANIAPDPTLHSPCRTLAAGGFATDAGIRSDILPEAFNAETLPAVRLVILKQGDSAIRLGDIDMNEKQPPGYNIVIYAFAPVDDGSLLIEGGHDFPMTPYLQRNRNPFVCLFVGKQKMKPPNQYKFVEVTINGYQFPDALTK